MKEFRKYSSIENHYQQKFIGSFANQFGAEALNQQFIVSEKLDGANIQLLFSPNEKMKVGKRTSYLEEGDSFFDIWNTLKKYQDVWDKFQRRSEELQKEILIYGEIYGIGINGRIDYGEGKYIKIFDIVDEEYLPQNELLEVCDYMWINHMLPYYQVVNSLNEALAIEIPENSEGWVIQPFTKVYRMGTGSRFILKKKAANFDDKVSDKVKEKRDCDNSLNIKFREFINENRLKDLFSKHGEIERPQQIPDYIKLMMEDAKIDFLKENDISNLEPKDQKEVFNVGSMIVMMLKQYL